MQQIKGTGRRFSPQILNTVGGPQSHWVNNSPLWRASRNETPYICGGWFKTWGTEGHGTEPSRYIALATQDYDTGNPAGYARYRFRFDNLANANAGMLITSYRGGGDAIMTLDGINRAIEDFGQWWHVMAFLIDSKNCGIIVNGKYMGDIYFDNQHGPYPNSSQSLVTAVFTHRWAGAWYEPASASMWIYEYFMMNMPDYINSPEWQARGVDPNNKDTWANPWLRNSGGIYLDPITNADDTGRQALIAGSARGISGTIAQDRNDWSAVYDADTFTSVQFPSGTATGAYSQQPVYGYDLRELT